MYRRTVIGTLGTGLLWVFAGCTGSRVDGVVATNETPLAFSHEYATQATSSGTRVVVDVTVENDGGDPIALEKRVSNWCNRWPSTRRGRSSSRWLSTPRT
jgi:hypothetical protein